MNIPDDNGAAIPDATVPPELLALIAQKTPTAIAVFSRSTQALLYHNRAFGAWIDPEKRRPLVGMTLQEVLGVDSKDSFFHHVLPHVLVFGIWEGQINVRDAWGSEKPASASLNLMRYADHGECLVLLLSRLERPKAKLGEMSASDSDLLHALMETVSDCIYFKDAQSRFLRVSTSMALRAGFTDASQLIGLTDFDLYTAEHARPAFEDEQRIIKTGEPIINLEEKETYSDGHIRWMSTSKFPIKDREGKIVGTFGISRDVTDRKKAEDDRREMELQMNLSQKLESIGHLASGLAHEINTPAQFITDNTQFIKKALHDFPSVFAAYQKLQAAVARGDDTKDLLEEIAKLEHETRLEYVMRELPQTVDDSLEGLSRVNNIVKSLKEFSHPNRAVKSQMNLNRCIETTVAISRHEWKYVADLETDLDPNLPQVPGVVDEINQVILNLVVNAAHAIEEAQTKQGIAQKGKIKISTRLEENYAVMCVADNGSGISDEARSRLFEPFFTTKEVGKGTGQGLAISRNVIVKKHGGRIDFESEIGKGTCFSIRLPLEDTEPAI